jgi:hypothetical protein
MPRFLVLTVAATLLLAVQADAAGPASFSCTANAVTTQLSGKSKLNPVTAGGDGQECRVAVAGLPNTSEALSLDAVSKARTAYAAVDPHGDIPSESTPSAAAGVEALEVTVGGSLLTVSAANSEMTGACEGRTPKFTPMSEVANVTLADTPIVVDGVVQPTTDEVSNALGAAVEVRVNEVLDLQGGGKAVRAVRVTLVRDSSVAEVIVAESRLGLNGAACDPGAGGDVLAAVCPSGSVYDVEHNVCVIPAPGSQTAANPVGDITGPGSVVVGPPQQGPSGGTVMTLSEAQKRFGRSPCVKGKGPRYVVLGTNGRDRITGTNRRDRILGRRGSDRIDSGRGRDCVDAGRQKDFITGGQGRDRMYGGRARDIVNGDGKADRLFGGRGNDTLNSAYGADRVRGGRGNDKINVATAGARATVWAGRGRRDKVRCNPRELKRIHGAEIIKVTRPFKG